MQIDCLVRGICCAARRRARVCPRTSACAACSAATSSTAGSTGSATATSADGEPDGPMYLIGSADLMPRNLDRRVEVLVPIDHPKHREWLDQVLDFALADDIVRGSCGPTTVGSASARPRRSSPTPRSGCTAGRSNASRPCRRRFAEPRAARRCADTARSPAGRPGTRRRCGGFAVRTPSVHLPFSQPGEVRHLGSLRSRVRTDMSRLNGAKSVNSLPNGWSRPRSSPASPSPPAATTTTQQRDTTSPAAAATEPPAAATEPAAEATEPPTDATEPAAEGTEPPATGDLELAAGDVFVSGSSTVEPISIRVGELADELSGGELKVTVEGPGTGDGFAKFCARRDRHLRRLPPDQGRGSASLRRRRHRVRRAQGRHRRPDGHDQPGQHRRRVPRRPGALRAGRSRGRGIDNWSDADDLAAEVGSAYTPFPEPTRWSSRPR